MMTSQRLGAALTPLDRSLAMLLEGVGPAGAIALPLDQALGCIAAGMPALQAFPPFDLAIVDGWACRSGDLVGASSWSPASLTAAPLWVEAGDKMPEGFDCVVDAAVVEQSGPVFEISAEAIPGQGIRRAAGDIPQKSLFPTGQPVRPLDLLLARAAALDRLSVRRPKLRILNIPAKGQAVTAPFIAEMAGAEGCEVVRDECDGRDARTIANAFGAEWCDLLLTIGGSGVGHSDATALALAARGAVLAHGIALQPGRTAAIGRIDGTPVIALPGAPDQALAGLWSLVLPVLDRLSERKPRPSETLPLARKIASRVGMAEIVLLGKADRSWMPIAAGELSLTAIAAADAWLAVPGGSEGYAAGTPVNGYMLRDGR